MKFRRKPIVLEAIQYDGKNLVEILLFTGAPEASDDLMTDCLTIRTLEGDMTAQPGDWIIKGIKGEFYPCKPDIFDAIYEAVTE